MTLRSSAMTATFTAPPILRRLGLLGLVLSTVGAIAAGRSVGETPRIESLALPAAPGGAQSNLAASPDGKVYVSWMEPAPDSAMALRFASFDGTRWTSPKTIRAGRDFFLNWADFQSLSVRGDGRLAAHWLQKHGGTAYAYDIRIAQSSDDGRTWSTPIAPHEDRSSTEKGFVTMWREGADGRLGAVWLDGRKADKASGHPVQEMMLYTTTIGSNGVASKEVQLDARTCDCCQTTAAMTSAGPIVAYRDRSPDEIRDIHVTRRVNGAWTSPKAVFADNWHIKACPVNGPFVAAAGRRVALAWFTGANETPRVKIAFSADAGATFSPPIVVDEGNPAGRVAALLLDDGSALVSWIERGAGDTAAVRVRRVHERNGVGAALTVTASSAARTSGFPRMLRAGKHVYFSWTQPGNPSSVHAARAALADFK